MLKTLIKGLPIEGKISFAILLTCATALAVTAVGIFFAQLTTFRQNFRGDLASIGEIIANNSTAEVQYGYGKDLEQLLSALRAKPHIVFASITLPAGTELAAFRGERLQATPAIPSADGFHFVGPCLVLNRPIMLGSERIGTLHLASDYQSECRRSLLLYAAILAGVLVVSVVLAFLVSARLRRLISAPILDLAAAAQRIADKKDYRVRAKKVANDEVGRLTDAFNTMLARLESDDAALRQANQSLEAEIAERKQTQVALQQSEERFRSLFENATIGLYRTNAAGQVLLANPTLLRMLGCEALSNLPFGRDVAEGYVDGVQREQFKSLMEAQGEVRGFEAAWKRRDGSELFVRESARAIRNASGALLYYEGTVEDVTERRKAELELQRLNKELVVASRHAGMAKVATGVLHNVGNVLNSVNVSTTLLREKLRKSEIASVVRLAGLLQDHAADSASFFTTDPKGKLVPKFIIQVAARLQEQQADLEREHEQLGRNVEHIKEIVAMQQNYARLSGVVEQVSISSLMDDALALHTAGLARHGVRVVREYSQVPLLTVDKHKVLQILVNLVHNAKYALDASGRPDRVITAAIHANGGNRIRVTITDNGIGIPPENLTRIFSHGFTTRKDGHGFGLHSGANAAKEMGGSLTGHSEGPGKGATFTLELPLAYERAKS